ncbi:MAG: ABC transporter permease [Alphaproteobacteria bacterium]|nr:ABC transporter permease [Alphaproteobacteria bacterium]
MNTRWSLFLVVPLAVSLVLLVASQSVFLESSLHADLGFGRMAPAWSLHNYIRVLTDDFYLRVLWLTVMVSGIAAVLTIVVGFPIAYVLARMRSRWAGVLMLGILLSTFVTIVIKIFGLIVIFNADGPVNRLLLGAGIVAKPINLIGTPAGVVVGLMYFTIGFAVLLMYAVARTVPRSVEEAAEIHGASRRRVFLRVILPICLPGIAVGFLTVFNMCMGAFTSAALLGGGRVLTLPVLIQRTILFEVKYGMAGTISAILLFSVLLINLFGIFVLRRFRIGRRVVA